MSSSKGRQRANVRQYSAEDQALNQISAEAESRLAAKRAARAEAREIRMKEIEKQQKEAEENEANQSNSSSTKVREYDSRRGSGDSTESDTTKDPKDRNYKQELRELQDKFKNAMMTSAQLDNEKQSLVYQVELLKDQFEEHEEGYLELQREYKSKCSEFELQKRSLRELSGEHSLMKSQVEYLDKLLKENGLVIITAESGEMSLQKDQSAIPSGSISTGAALLSAETIEILKKAGEGSLGTKNNSKSGHAPDSTSDKTCGSCKETINDTGQKSDPPPVKESVELHPDSVISELNSEEDKKVLANLEKDTASDEIDGCIFLKPSTSLADADKARNSEQAMTNELPRDSRESTVESDTKGSQSEGDSALDQYSEDVNDALENVTLDDQIPPSPDQKSKNKPAPLTTNSLSVPNTLGPKSSVSDSEEFFDAPSTPLPPTPLPVVNDDQKINLNTSPDNVKTVDSSNEKIDKKAITSETLDADLMSSLVQPSPASKSERKKKKSRCEVESLSIPDNLNSKSNDTPSPRSDVEKLKFPSQIGSSGPESSELDSPRPNPQKEEPQGSKSKKNKKKNKKRKNESETQKFTPDLKTKSVDAQNNNTNISVSADALKNSEPKSENSDQNLKSDSQNSNVIDQNSAQAQAQATLPEKDPPSEEGKGGKKKRKKGKNKGKSKGKQDSVDNIVESSSIIGASSAALGAISGVMEAISGVFGVGGSESGEKKVESKKEEPVSDVPAQADQKSGSNTDHNQGSSVDVVDIGSQKTEDMSNCAEAATEKDVGKDPKLGSEGKTKVQDLEMVIDGSSVDFDENNTVSLTSEASSIKDSSNDGKVCDKDHDSDESNSEGKIKAKPVVVGEAEDTFEELSEKEEEFVEAVEELKVNSEDNEQNKEKHKNKETDKKTNPEKSSDQNNEENLIQKTDDNAEDLPKEQSDVQDADDSTETLAKRDDIQELPEINLPPVASDSDVGFNQKQKQDPEDEKNSMAPAPADGNPENEKESKEKAPADGNPEDEKESKEEAPADGNPEDDKKSKEEAPADGNSKDNKESKEETLTDRNSKDEKESKEEVPADGKPKVDEKAEEAPADGDFKEEKEAKEGVPEGNLEVKGEVIGASVDGSPENNVKCKGEALEGHSEVGKEVKEVAPVDENSEDKQPKEALEEKKSKEETQNFKSNDKSEQNAEPEIGQQSKEDVLKASVSFDTTVVKTDEEQNENISNDLKGDNTEEQQSELNKSLEESKQADASGELDTSIKTVSSPESPPAVDLIDQAAEMLAQLQRLKSGKKGKSKKKKKSEEQGSDSDLKKEPLLDQEQQGSKISPVEAVKNKEDSVVVEKKNEQEPTNEKKNKVDLEMPTTSKDKKVEMTTDLDASFEEASEEPSKDSAQNSKLETNSKKEEMTTDLDASFEETPSEAAAVKEAQKTPEITVMTTDLDASLEDLTKDSKSDKAKAVDLNESVENEEYSFDDIDDVLGDDSAKALPSPSVTETTSLASSRSSFSSLKAPEHSEPPKSPKVDKKSKKKKKSDRDSAEVPPSPTTSPKEEHNKNGGEKQKKKGFLKGFFK